MMEILPRLRVPNPPKIETNGFPVKDNPYTFVKGQENETTKSRIKEYKAPNLVNCCPQHHDDILAAVAADETSPQFYANQIKS